MDPSTLARSQQIAATVLDSVSPDQLDRSTPCTQWTVAQVIDHLVGAQHWARSGMEGVEMTDTGEGSSAGDFRATFRAAATSSLAAFNVDGALARTVNPGFGDMPAVGLLAMAATDTFTHAWDLAKATGQSTDLDPELAAELLTSARASIPPTFRSEEGSIFGLEQTAPEGATAADQLAAFLGRTV